ncbi:MAG TPA: zinc-ribbon domain-containing protein [Fimbriimonas sp.]|nr:zinc-ribbon domain-containing protein [Fimbriimonas sp.]
MNCPRCRAVVPNGASFCSNCGNDLRAFITPQQTVPQQPYNPRPTEQSTIPPGAGFHAAQVAQPKKSHLGKIIGGLAILILVALGFLAMKMLDKTAQDPGPVLAAKGKDEPILKVEGKDQPVLQTNAEAPAEMPADVLRWLQHLERIERQRGVLARSGLANLMIMAQTAQYGLDLDGLKALASGDPDAEMPPTSVDKVAESSAKTKEEWKALRRDFDSFPPPAECQTIADSYGPALDETGGMIGDVLDAVALSKDDTQKALQSLYAMQNTSKTIDEYGNATDGKVADICNKYNKRKWFSISSDFGNTSILGAVGNR